MVKVQYCSVEKLMTAAQWCKTLTNSFSFWKETFIQCMALEAFILEVMRKNIKNKEKQKNKGKCLYSCSGMSDWTPTILMVNTGKIFVGSQRQRNKSPVLQSTETISQQSKSVLSWLKKKPWQNLWSISVPLYDNPTEGTDKCKSFLPGYQVKQSRPTPRLSFSPTNPTLKRFINITAETLKKREMRFSSKLWVFINNYIFCIWEDLWGKDLWVSSGTEKSNCLWTLSHTPLSEAATSPCSTHLC